MKILKPAAAALVLTSAGWLISIQAGAYRDRSVTASLEAGTRDMVRLLDDMDAAGWPLEGTPDAAAYLRDILRGHGVSVSAAARQEPVPVSRIRRFSLARIPVRERSVLLDPDGETVLHHTVRPLPRLHLFLRPVNRKDVKTARNGKITVTAGNFTGTIGSASLYKKTAWFDRATGETVYQVTLEKTVGISGNRMVFRMSGGMPGLILKGLTFAGYREGKRVFRPVPASVAHGSGVTPFLSGTAVPLEDGIKHLTPVNDIFRKFHVLYSGPAPSVSVRTASGKDISPGLTENLPCGNARQWGASGESLFCAGMILPGADTVRYLLTGGSSTLYGITGERASGIAALLAGRKNAVLEVREERIRLRENVLMNAGRFGWHFGKAGKTLAAVAPAAGPVEDGGWMTIRETAGQEVLVTGSGTVRRFHQVRMFITVFLTVILWAGVLLRHGRRKS